MLKDLLVLEEKKVCEHETLLENKVLFVNLDTHDQLLG